MAMNRSVNELIRQVIISFQSSLFNVFFLNVLSMRKQSVPVCGSKWYSLTDQIDWDIALAEKRGKVNECGLYDLNRNSRPVEDAYKILLKWIFNPASLCEDNKKCNTHTSI
jgi:hypothetical protein